MDRAEEDDSRCETGVVFTNEDCVNADTDTDKVARAKILIFILR
jgi:hypothetical protein